MDLDGLLESLRKKRYAWIAGAAITLPVNVALTLYPDCLVQVLVGILTFGILYFFGVRSLRKFFWLGLVIIILTGIIFGALYTHFLYNREYIFEPEGLGNSHLEAGQVTPYQGNQNTYFNYSVMYNGVEDPGNITVLVNISDSNDVQIISLLLEDHDDLYYNQTALGDEIYFYHFAVLLQNQDKWIETEEAQGPLTISYSDMMGIQMFIGFGYVILNGGLVFFLILGLYYWKITEWQKQISEKDKESEGNH